MKNQIITALSIVAVLGAAGGAYAANQSVLTSASSEESVIGTATPVLVPIAPKGAEIPEEYRQRFADAANGTLPGHGAPGLETSSTDDPADAAPPAGGSGARSSDDDDDEHDEIGDQEDHDEDDEHDEDESDDDD